MSVAHVLLHVRDHPVREIEIIFSVHDDLWIASSHLDWAHYKTPSFVNNIWRNKYSGDIYVVTDGLEGESKLYVSGTRRENWVLVNAKLPFECNYCDAKNLGITQILVRPNDVTTFYSRDSGKSWSTPDALWLERYFAEEAKKSHAAYTRYSREQIDSGVRAVYADEIAIEEEFERVRTD